MTKIITIILLSTLLYACSGLVDGINQDPNNPTSASYENILTGSQVGNIILQTGETARRAGIFSGYYTGLDRQHLGFSNYSLTTSDFNALWSDIYVDTYRNALVAADAAEQEGIEGITLGITQVMRAYAIGTAASLYGDVPFEEAGKIEIENPAYEEQLAVYNSVQSLLDQAISNLESGGGRPASGADIYYNGDPERWREAAYTLKARFFMHTQEYAQAYSAAQNGVSSFGSSMYAPHGSGLEESNLTYLFFAVEVRGADVIVSDFMSSLVDSDPLENTDPGLYRGHSKTDETARFNFYFNRNNLGVQPNTIDGFAAATASAPLITYQENLLILAEAGFRSEGFEEALIRLNDFRAFMNEGGYIADGPAPDLLYDPFEEADFTSGGIENMDGIDKEAALLREILEEDLSPSLIK
ncbi:SusD/RagB family nutrient-binding outer membrane lipoprotein [Portibacter marinus]|uniref:SusD/RagB family nutrient-binding outer membrane lipoprotein n=1 Tax=Portibacter marinus TaxID=2898660 RepID=UPI001F236154|nr:SusD/RagB family nutrient-binding outer membrane lipoprotein [Portibacter marinus]